MQGIYGLGWGWLIILILLGIVIWMIFRSTRRRKSKQTSNRTELDRKQPGRKDRL